MQVKQYHYIVKELVDVSYETIIYIQMERAGRFLIQKGNGRNMFMENIMRVVPIIMQ